MKDASSTLIQQHGDTFLSIEPGDRGKVLYVFTDQHGPEGKDVPAEISLMTFVSNTDPDRYFVAVTDRDPNHERQPSEATFYVNAEQAAVLAQCFAAMSAKLASRCI